LGKGNIEESLRRKDSVLITFPENLSHRITINKQVKSFIANQLNYIWAGVIMRRGFEKKESVLLTSHSQRASAIFLGGGSSYLNGM
jgi:hypothetical protein